MTYSTTWERVSNVEVTGTGESSHCQYCCDIFIVLTRTCLMDGCEECGQFVRFAI